MTATFRLMQDSGVQGPKTTVEFDDGDLPATIKQEAVNWSMGQLGHPWDVLTIEVPDIDYTAEIRLPEGVEA